MISNAQSWALKILVEYVLNIKLNRFEDLHNIGRGGKTQTITFIIVPSMTKIINHQNTPKFPRNIPNKHVLHNNLINMHFSGT